MKKFRLSSLSFILLGTSIIVLGIVLGLGSLIKRLEITIGLLILPILLSLSSDITAIVSLTKKDDRKLQLILTIILSTLLSALMILLMLMLRGLWRLT